MSIEDGAEPKEIAGFHIETLLRGENGVDMGPYKEDIVGFYRQLFPDRDKELTEVIEDVEELVATSTEAIMLAFEGNTPIGFGTVSPLRDGDMQFQVAYVSPQYRRQGVYARLIQERVNFAQSRGANSVSLEALDSNTAQDSLVKYGFTKIPDPDAVGEARYRKQLK